MSSGLMKFTRVNPIINRKTIGITAVCRLLSFWENDFLENLVELFTNNDYINQDIGDVDINSFGNNETANFYLDILKWYEFE